MASVFIDANVFLHAVGDDPQLRAACGEVLVLAGARRLSAEVSTLVISEVVHVRRRRTGNRALAVAAGRGAARLCTVRVVLPADLPPALGLFGEYDALDMNDAVHLAVAQRHGVHVMVTTDRGFAGIPGVRRVDPTDRAAISALISG